MDHNFSHITQYRSFRGLIPQPAIALPHSFGLNVMPLDYFDFLLKFQEHQYQKIYYSWIAQNLTSLRRDFQAVSDKSKLALHPESNHLYYPLQREEIPKFALNSKKLPEPVKEEENVQKGPQKENPPTLRTQITNMVSYFIDEHGQCEQNRIEQQRNLYSSRPVLLELFDTLKDKYSSARKCREDMIRLAMRKALTCLRDSLRDQLNISAKEASSELCKRYFGVKAEALVKVEGGSDDKDEEDDLSFLLPYKKNSKYSTPNMCFVREIFASKEFNQDYIGYLAQLDDILEQDNRKKIPKFIDFLLECVQKNLICRVKNYKRLPWLKTWLKATKVVAVELLDPSTWKDIPRKKSTCSKKRKTTNVSNGIKAEKLS